MDNTPARIDSNAVDPIDPVEKPYGTGDYSINNYDRQGNRIDMAQYLALHSDFEYRTVAKTNVEVNGSVLHVSTMWLGFDHRFGLLDGEGPPIIFETMIFGDYEGHDMQDVMQERYSTEEEALAGHETAVSACRRLGAIEPDAEQSELE